MADLTQMLRRRLEPAERYGLRLTLTALALVLVAVPFSYLLLEVLRDGPFTRVDEDVARHLHERVVDQPALVAALKAVSLLGKPLWLAFAVAAGAAFVCWRGRRRLALYLVVTAIGGGIVDTAVKVAVNRPRPEVASPLATAFGKSFPSGHAMSSTVTYGALLLVLLPALPRRWRLVALAVTVALVLAIGVSRLMLGVHYVSDVVAGWTLGLAWLCGATAAFSIWRTDEGRQPVQVTKGVEPEAAAALRGDPS
ncbi:MAG: phosphatase PAP2 family protein [Actinobacteria bacterium]|nr:phosphatase PAP2 family protein [Actinomycetota bacterium]